MLRVGLTGSIAVGKSFVASVFTELGCHVLDADAAARTVVVPGTEGLRRVVEAFGTEILRPDGSLDRPRLGAIVFADAQRRALLNSILHPLIIAAQDTEMRRWEERDPQGIGIVDAALMIETGSYRRFDKLIVVYCQTHVQLERLMRRSGLSLAEAEERIAAQMPQDEKKRYADYLIDTTEGFESTRQQTEDIYVELKEQSRVIRAQ